MAFNPFAKFRKHQKVIFAALTIICMLTFVLAYGKGDIFDRAAHWFGARGKNPPVTKVYGSPVTIRELDSLRQQRVLAREALGVALSTAAFQVQNEKNSAGALKFDNPDALNKALELNRQEQKLQSLDARMGAHFGNPNKVESLLDYLVWKKQADELNIYLDDKDVDAELKNLTGGRVTLKEVSDGLRQGNRRGGDPDSLRSVLKDEFRVLLAQIALLGSAEETRQPMPMQMADPVDQTPALFTPYEFWKYYLEQRTTLQVALLPVPVPTTSTTQARTEELQALFNLYKDVEASPTRAEPGFKEPRRVKVEWASTRADTDAARKATEAMLPVLQALQFVTAFQPHATGASGDAFATQLGLVAAGSNKEGKPSGLSPHVLAGYEDLKRFGRFDLAAIAQPDYSLSIYTSVGRPDNTAVLVGEAFSAPLTLGSPLGSLLSYQASAVGRNAKEMEPLVAQEAARRAPTGVTQVLIGTASPFTAAAIAYDANQAKQYLPPEAVRAQVLERAYSVLAKDWAIAKLLEFAKELDNRRHKPEEVRAWLPKALVEYGIAGHQEMKEALDQYTISDTQKNPALAPLKEVYQRTDKMMGGPKGEQFGMIFFGGTGLYQPQMFPPVFDPRMRQWAQALWTMSDEPYLVWRTEDQKAFVPTFDAVKDKVAAAWAQINARTQARKDAEKLLAEARKTGGDPAQIRQLAAENKREIIELNQVARQVPDPSAAATLRRQYTPYQFPDLISYPKKDMLDKLLALKNKGEAVLLSNEPEKVFYVAILTDRTEPSLISFHDAYKEGSSRVQPDPLLNEFLKERRTKYREAFLKQLRIAAGADPEGKFVVDAEARKSIEGRGRDDTEE
jgi:hypothetical protein